MKYLYILSPHIFNHPFHHKDMQLRRIPVGVCGGGFFCLFVFQGVCFTSYYLRISVIMTHFHSFRVCRALFDTSNVTQSCAGHHLFQKSTGIIFLYYFAFSLTRFPAILPTVKNGCSHHTENQQPCLLTSYLALSCWYF